MYDISFDLKNINKSAQIKRLIGSDVKSNNIIALLNSLKTDRSGCYTRKGNRIDVDQGCIFTGTPDLVLESYGFETCAPFIMYLNKDAKMILGHIDASTEPEEIVDTIKKHFSPKEIENADYYYFRGEESSHPKEKLGRFAIKTIEDALDTLGVKGNYCGRIGGFDRVIVNSNGMSVKECTI